MRVWASCPGPLSSRETRIRKSGAELLRPVLDYIAGYANPALHQHPGTTAHRGLSDLPFIILLSGGCAYLEGARGMAKDHLIAGATPCC